MISVVQILLALYCFVGMLTGVPALVYSGIIISFIIQILALVVITGRSKGKLPRPPLIIYLANVSLIALIILMFILADYPMTDVLNRALTLLSIFGLTIVFCIPEIRIDKTVKTILILFAMLGAVLIADSLRYGLSGHSIWPPISYISNRFAGPFFDPNFLSITYSFLFIVMLYNRHLVGRLRNLFLMIFATSALLGGSWSAIGILAVSLLLVQFIRSSNLGKKQIIILVFYFALVLVASNSLYRLYDSFESTASIFGVDTAESTAKFVSFENRVIVQNDALLGILSSPLGHGPQSIVPDLGRDTHNSYVGFVYELGVIGVCLLLINMTYKQSRRNKMNDTLTTFFFIVALTINIHYSSIYFMLLLIISRQLEWGDMNEDKATNSKITHLVQT